MNENQAEIKAQAVETEMKKYFGSLVSDFNLIDAFYGNGHEEFSLGFKYCDYLICVLIMVKVLADAAYVMIGVIIMRLYLLKPQLMVGGKKFQFNGKNIFMNLKKNWICVFPMII